MLKHVQYIHRCLWSCSCSCGASCYFLISYAFWTAEFFAYFLGYAVMVMFCNLADSIANTVLAACEFTLNTLKNCPKSTLIGACFICFIDIVATFDTLPRRSGFTRIMNFLINAGPTAILLVKFLLLIALFLALSFCYQPGAFTNTCCINFHISKPQTNTKAI